MAATTEKQQLAQELDEAKNKVKETEGRLEDKMKTLAHLQSEARQQRERAVSQAIYVVAGCVADVLSGCCTARRTRPRK